MVYPASVQEASVDGRDGAVRQLDDACHRKNRSIADQLRQTSEEEGYLIFFARGAFSCIGCNQSEFSKRKRTPVTGKQAFEEGIGDGRKEVS